MGLPALVVDFHGDMAAAPAGGAAVLDASQGLEISPFERDCGRLATSVSSWRVEATRGLLNSSARVWCSTFTASWSRFSSLRAHSSCARFTARCSSGGRTPARCGARRGPPPGS